MPRSDKGCQRSDVKPRSDKGCKRGKPRSDKGCKRSDVKPRSDKGCHRNSKKRKASSAAIEYGEKYDSELSFLVCGYCSYKASSSGYALFEQLLQSEKHCSGIMFYKSQKQLTYESYRNSSDHYDRVYAEVYNNGLNEYGMLHQAKFVCNRCSKILSNGSTLIAANMLPLPSSSDNNRDTGQKDNHNKNDIDESDHYDSDENDISDAEHEFLPIHECSENPAVGLGVSDRLLPLGDRSVSVTASPFLFFRLFSTAPFKRNAFK